MVFSHFVRDVEGRRFSEQACLHMYAMMMILSEIYHKRLMRGMLDTVGKLPRYDLVPAASALFDTQKQHQGGFQGFDVQASRHCNWAEKNCNSEC